jgi:hypothetical protein
MEISYHDGKRIRHTMKKQLFTALLKLNKKEEQEERSREWFREKAKDVSSVDSARIIRSGAENSETRIRNGHLYFYRYDAKTKDELPYFDRYPIVFPFRRKTGGFLGLNLHYLPHELRAVLMDELYEFVVGEEDTQKLNIIYRILKNAFSMKLYKPCVKHYLGDYIDSRIIRVYPEEWDVALFLPLQRFTKVSESRVYRDSISIIRKG